MFQFMKYYELVNSSFWTNLLIAIIGAFIGVLGSLLIFRKTIKRDIETKEKEERKFFKERIRLLLYLLESILKNVENQCKEYEIQAKNIIAKPYTFHTVKLSASNQIDRLLAIDIQDIFKAFLFYFGDSDETIKKCNNYLGYVDYISSRLKQAIDSNENNIGYIAERQEEFRKHFNHLYFNFNDLFDVEPKLKNIGRVYINSFNEYVKGDSIEFRSLNEDLLIPLFKNVADVELKNESTRAKLLNFIGNCTAVLNQIKINNEKYAKEEALALEDELKEKIEKLRQIKKELEVSIELV